MGHAAARGQDPGQEALHCRRPRRGYCRVHPLRVRRGPLVQLRRVRVPGLCVLQGPRLQERGRRAQLAHLLGGLLLLLPQTQGAKKLYEDVLSKALKPYVAMIDGATADAINKVQGAASKLSGEASAAVGKESVKSD